MESIDIVLASDNNYAQHLGVTILSILNNATGNELLVFHILASKISEENEKKLIIICKNKNAKIIFYQIKDADLKGLPEIGHLSKATYLRLFIPALLPTKIERVIYLDCDLIVLKDIKNLYQQSLAEYSLGAVKDVKSKEILRIYFYSGIESYFNAGVLLINLKKWREQDITNKALKFIEQYAKELTTADQDVLNCLFNGDWLEINKKFNMDMKHNRIGALPNQDTEILHYSDKIKPWSYLYVGKNKKYYFQYLKLSPWPDFKYKDKNIKNLFKRYALASNKIIKNILRPITPNKIIDWHKKKFLKNIKYVNR